MTSVAQPPDTLERLCGLLGKYVSRINARGVVVTSLRRSGLTADAVARQGVTPGLLKELDTGLRLYGLGEAARRECITALGGWRPEGAAAATAAAEVELQSEASIVEARATARGIAQAVGFNHTDQIKIATAVSEIARNAQRYAGRGRMKITALSAPRGGIRIECDDDGPGIENLDQILAGDYQSRTGMGLGLLGCKRLMDELAIRAEPGRGTHVTMSKYLPA